MMQTANDSSLIVHLASQSEERALRVFDPADLGEIERLLVEVGRSKRIFRRKCDVTKLWHGNSRWL
jgi:hypothetical protein